MAIFKKLFIGTLLCGAISAQAQLGLQVQTTESAVTPKCGQRTTEGITLRCGLQEVKPRCSYELRERGEGVKVCRVRPQPEDLAPGQVVYTELRKEDGGTNYIVTSKP